MTPQNHEHDPSDVPGGTSDMDRLTDAWLDGVASPEEELRLAARVAAQPADADAFVRRARLNHAIGSTLHCQRLLAASPVEAPRAPALRLASRRWGRWAIGLAASFALAFVGFAAWHRFHPAQERRMAETGEVPCRLSNAMGAVWADAAIAPGGRPSTRTVSIAAGVTELTLDSGVRLLLEGPASLDVTGRNSCRLAYGKMVADVPAGAQGFTVEGPAEKIVDHGTRFAVDIARDGSRTTLGVLSGEVELQPKDAAAHGGFGKPVRLFTDYAVEHRGEEIQAIPFDRSRFITEISAAHYGWNFDGAPFDTPRTLRFALPTSMRVPGDLRITFKWLAGRDALVTRHVRLLRDGEEVAASHDPRSAGDPRHSEGDALVLAIPSGIPLDGLLELELESFCKSNPGQKVANSQGIVVVSKISLTHAQASDFLGRWEYSHGGETYIREFLPDGRMVLYLNGAHHPYQGNPRWTLKGDTLVVDFNNGVPLEAHALVDQNTLVFLDRNYLNAHRVGKANKREP